MTCVGREDGKGEYLSRGSCFLKGGDATAADRSARITTRDVT
jgi:hypothetical protein